MSNEIITKIVELKQKIEQIPDSENFDDLKELEYFDLEIVNIIYDYCFKRNYSIDGFPEKYIELIENNDEDFFDFLDFDTKYYYILKCSITKIEVFEMIKSYYISPKDINYQDDDCRKDILINIEQLEKENINLVFNRADYNHYESLTKWRPKLP
ncbi:hypothetical protein [Flavobacterium sasangense]|uniref:hypothetical protein n=1 Tax=Flavobacterium sasangense TaxID=503361 RepID=UPI00047EEE95|nr:hypothetical protein [Flavobacterium sasangense]